mgnify:CR=1 FL=1
MSHRTEQSAFNFGANVCVSRNSMFCLEGWISLGFLGIPREAHPLRVGRCASDLWLFGSLRVARCEVIRCFVVRCAVISDHVARCADGK